MKKSTNKYPFFTRLKRAWQAYNEPMPVNNDHWDGSHLSGPTNKEMLKRIHPEFMNSEAPGWYDKARNKRNTTIEVASVKHIHTKKKHTLVKRGERLPFIDIGQVYYDTDFQKLFHVEEISKGNVVVCYPNDNNRKNIILHSFKEGVKKGDFELHDTINVRHCKHCGKRPNIYIMAADNVCTNQLCEVHKK